MSDIANKLLRGKVLYRDVVGRKVRLLTELRTKGGVVFRKGAVLRVIEFAGDFEHRTKRLVETFANVTSGVSATSARRRAVRYPSRLRAGKEEA